MRRTRIKVMATVPPQRRSAIKEEKIDANVSKEVDSKEKNEDAPPQIEESKLPSGPTIKEEKLQSLDNNDSEIPTTNIVSANDNQLNSSSDTTEAENTKNPESRDTQAQKEVEETNEKSNQLAENLLSPVESKNSGQESVPTAKVSQPRGSFMRPTPRLDGGGRIRRNSIQGSGASASESEDDSRRTTSVIATRIRNDSVSSVHSQKESTRENSSNVGNSISNNGSSVNTASTLTSSKSITNIRQKRKMNVSESARKLAEARREFHLKYEHKQPDRAKLTMYDLIYYNPTTNPIKKKDDSSKPKVSPVVIQPEVEEEEEECEESEAMPVPQVKVGPNGQIILDEQSLVIENTGVKKSRQALARMEALVDDENTGNGFYKKRQKSKDWPNWETLKFYKALNTVGTDFLLMQSLFPHRTRQEIKMKFKKEEKTNRKFVEKALTYHQEFDIESLTEDLASFETVNKQLEAVAAQKSVRKEKGTKRTRRMAAQSIGESNDGADSPAPSFAAESIEALEDEEIVEKEEEKIKKERKKAGKRKPVADESEEINSESVSSSDERVSDSEVYVVRPTRSGRLPKVRKLQAPAINTLDNSFESVEQKNNGMVTVLESDPLMLEDAENTEIIFDGPVETSNEVLIPENSHITEAEPGSVVIVSQESQDEPGQTVFQVYMVSSDGESANGLDAANALSNTSQTV